MNPKSRGHGGEGGGREEGGGEGSRGEGGSTGGQGGRVQGSGFYVSFFSDEME